MCDRNGTSAFMSLLLHDHDLARTDLPSQLDQRYMNSLLVSVLNDVLLSTALPGMLVIFSWVLWLLYYASYSSNGSKLPLPPGSMGLPLIGETLTFFVQGAAFYRKRRQLYGDVFKTHLLGGPVVRVVGADNVRKVLMGEHTLVSSFWPASLRLVLGQNNITMSSGHRHKVMRRHASKAFTHESFSYYTPVVQQMMRDCIQRWCQTTYVNSHKECSSMNFFILCRVLLGLEHLSLQQTDQMRASFETIVKNLFCLPIHFPGCGLAKSIHARNSVMQKLEECLLRKKLESASDVTSTRCDALWLMMQMTGGEGERQLTTEELKGVCFDFIFASFSTMGSSFTSLIYFLAKNPQVIQRVQQELEEQGFTDRNAIDMTYDTLSRLTYVGHVVKEVLLLAPPIGGGFRKVIKTFELDGYQIPEGWTVAYSIRETQAYSQLFTSSDQFQPERWEASISPGEYSFHYLPFGGGARTCIGKEYAKLLLKIMTVEMCRGCHWRLMNEDAKMKELPVPHFQDGLPICVTPISPADNPPQSSLSETVP